MMKTSPILICMIIIITMGCSWQTINLIKLYLSYPSKIEIVTAFDLYEDSMASVTLCKIVLDHGGRSSQTIFNQVNILDYFKSIYLKDHYIKLKKLADDHQIELSMMISLYHFCFILKGKLGLFS